MYQPAIGHTLSGRLVSKAQGKIGEKIEFHGTVIAQDSFPIHTPKGITYSHLHILEDDSGNIYKYKGSSLFHKGSRVHFVATIKGYAKGESFRSVVTVLRAPKLVSFH